MKWCVVQTMRAFARCHQISGSLSSDRTLLNGPARTTGRTISTAMFITWRLKMRLKTRTAGLVGEPALATDVSWACIEIHTCLKSAWGRSRIPGEQNIVPLPRFFAHYLVPPRGVLEHPGDHHVVLQQRMVHVILVHQSIGILSRDDAAILSHHAEMLEAVEPRVHKTGLVLERHHAAKVVPIERSP